MPASQPQPRRRAPREASAPRPPWLLPAGVAATALYLAWFYSGLLHEYAGFFIAGEPPSRWQFAVYVATHPADLMAAWLGEGGAWALSDRLAPLALATGVQLAALALGSALLRLLALAVTRPWERLVYSYAVGASALSSYVLLLGMLGALHRWLMAAPIVAAVALEFWSRFQAPSALPLPPGGSRGEGAPPPTSRSSDTPAWPWLLACAPFAVVILLGGLLPPTDFDVLEYHLEAPKEFFLAGRVGFLPHNVYGNMALGSEMLSLAAMVAADDWWLGGLAGKTIAACFALWTAAALFAIGRSCASTAAGGAAALVYLSIPWIVSTATSGLVEPAVSFYLLLAAFAVWWWREWIAPPAGRPHPGPPPKPQGDRLAGSSRLALVAGYFAGSAVACKYPAALFVLVPLAAYVAVQVLRRHARPRDLAAYLGGAAAACGLWFIKNAAMTGNPTYPLLYGLFGGATRTAELAARWNAAHDPPNFAPADLAARLLDLAGRSPWHSPLVVPLVILAAVAARRRPCVRLAFAYLAFIVAAWWLFTHRIDRFWVPALSLAALVAGLGVSRIQTAPARQLLYVLLAVGTSTNLLAAVSGPGGYNRYFAPLAQLRDASERRPDSWHRWIDAHVPPGQAVLLVGDAAVFDFRTPVAYNTAFDPPPLEEWIAGRTPAQIREELASRHIDYVYVNWRELARYRGPGNYGYSDFVTPELFERLVAEGVLAPALPPLENSPNQMFPVRR